MGTKIKQYPLSAIIEGYKLSLGARDLSPNTIEDYAGTLAKFSAFLVTDPPIGTINHHVEVFLASHTHLSNKSRLNYYIGLSSLWTWRVKEEIVPENVVRKITPPKAERREHLHPARDARAQLSRDREHLLKARPDRSGHRSPAR